MGNIAKIILRWTFLILILIAAVFDKNTSFPFSIASFVFYCICMFLTLRFTDAFEEHKNIY